MSKPILIFSDPHYHDFTQFSTMNEKGLNSRLADTLRATAQAYQEAALLGMEDAICAGDIFHVRGKVKPSVLNPTSNLFKSLHSGNGYKTYAISGNHDLETEKSSALNSSITSLRNVGMQVWSDNMGSAFFPKSNATVTFVPWEPDLNKLRKIIKDTYPAHPGYASALVLHAPMNGVIKGLPDHGLTPEDFKDCKFNKVFIGHYHNHKSFKVGDCEVISVGALTHQNFGDVENLAGYLLWYPKTGVVEHRETSAPKFVRVFAVDAEDVDESVVRDNYVKVIDGYFDDADEIQSIKDALILKGAKAVVVEGITKRPAVTRGTTTTSAAPTIHSILGDYVERTYPGESDVLVEALDILNEVYV